jgi:hypothetical protein
VVLPGLVARVRHEALDADGFARWRGEGAAGTSVDYGTRAGGSGIEEGGAVDGEEAMSGSEDPTWPKELTGTEHRSTTNRADVNDPREAISGRTATYDSQLRCAVWHMA